MERVDMRTHKQTRKNKHTSQSIEHHHLLMRIETAVCPLQEDKAKMEQMIHEIVKDVDMKPLGGTEVFYLNTPKYNEGLTAVQVIQTSHIAFHFWRRPARSILHCSRSQCLLQMDVYTCGKLTKKHIGIILQALARFDPTHADVTLLNRKWSLTVESHDTWDAMSNGSLSWAEWVRQRF
jgi:S-adenosylmethionine/arginine decarboxylase-like enzyme